MPSVSAPQIFDRSLLRRRHARASRLGGEDFLLARVAEDCIERLAPVKRNFSRILDLGTPRPALALRLAEALPQADITRAAPVFEALGQGPWHSLVADEECLPFGPERFDLVVSGLSLHMLNDMPGGLVQIRRALVPDGLLLACLLGGQTLTELRHCFAAAEMELLGGTSPRVAPFADLRDLGGLLQRAGFALPVTDVEPLTVRYDTIFGLFADLRAMGATNALTLRGRRPVSRRLLRRVAELYAARFADPDGRLRARFDLVWLSGWAPHDSQPKPLKPGSARMSLADALAGKAPPEGSGRG